MIGDLIDNLNEVLDHVGDRDEQLSRLITTFRTFVGGLKNDREAILDSLDQISALSVETADLRLRASAAPFVEDIKQLRRVAGNLDRGKAELDRALQVLPIKLNKIGRTATYGSWFNFYLCHFEGRVRLPGGRSLPVKYNVGAQGDPDEPPDVLRSASLSRTTPRSLDEQALPRAQPRDHRGDQPRRDRAADPGAPSAPRTCR